MFYGQDIPALAARRNDCMLLRLVVEGQPEPPAPPEGGEMPVLTLRVAVEPAPGLPPGLGEVAGLFAGFELMVATFGYLQGIVFAGQPAVEGYKRYARELRDGGGPLPPLGRSPWKVAGSTLELDFSAVGRAGLSAEEMARIAGAGEPAAALAAVLALARERGKLGYLDITYNGEPTAEMRAVFQRVREMGNRLLGIPVKPRTGPQDYHSTEQSETDGPPELTSVRFVCLEHEAGLAGEYGDRFLLAQAYGTWRAMTDARRWVVMATIPSAGEQAGAIAQLFDRAMALLGRSAP